MKSSQEFVSEPQEKAVLSLQEKFRANLTELYSADAQKKLSLHEEQMLLLNTSAELLMVVPKVAIHWLTPYSANGNPINLVFSEFSLVVNNPLVETLSNTQVSEDLCRAAMGQVNMSVAVLSDYIPLDPTVATQMRELCILGALMIASRKELIGELNIQDIKAFPLPTICSAFQNYIIHASKSSKCLNQVLEDLLFFSEKIFLRSDVVAICAKLTNLIKDFLYFPNNIISKDKGEVLWAFMKYFTEIGRNTEYEYKYGFRVETVRLKTLSDTDQAYVYTSNLMHYLYLVVAQNSDHPIRNINSTLSKLNGNFHSTNKDKHPEELSNLENLYLQIPHKLPPMANSSSSAALPAGTAEAAITHGVFPASQTTSVPIDALQLLWMP